MEVQQIYSLTNQITKEVLGESAVVNEDLSNIVDIGESVIGSNQIDNYVRSLVDHIGRVIFVNRPYAGSAPSVLMDGWEYGSILEKITVDSLPEAQENESWELKDGTSYDPNVFYKPEVSAKFFNSKSTWEIPMSFTEMQVKESFSNVEQLNGFMSMIYNSIDRSMTVRTDSLIMRTIVNMIAETIYADFPEASYTTGSGVKAVNLLYLYNQKFNTQLTKDQAIVTPEFIRYAVYVIGLYVSRLSRVSKLFNVGAKDRFTTPDLLHTVLLAEFAKAAGVYLYDGAGQFRTDNLTIGNFETVPYWQGSGLDYSFDSTSKIDVKTSSNNTVSLDGIIGVMFDRDSLGVCNQNRRVKSQYNPKAEFFNNFYKWDAQYFNDQNENFVVFFIQ